MPVTPPRPLPLYVIRGTEQIAVSILENGQWRDIDTAQGAPGSQACVIKADTHTV